MLLIALLQSVMGQLSACLQQAPSQYGQMTKLPGNDVPTGVLFQQYDQVRLLDCLNACQGANCVASVWTCSGNGLGQCQLFSSSQGRNGGCFECVGYVKFNGGPQFPGGRFPGGGFPQGGVSTTCPVPNAPFQFGSLSKLIGTDIPTGETIYQTENSNLNDCLNGCRTTSQCQGVHWECRQNGQGLCRLLGQINGRIPSNCANCLGYVKSNDGSDFPGGGFPQGGVSNTCPVTNAPFQFVRLSQLIGTDIPTGDTIYQTDNVNILDCLNGCRTMSQCQGVHWECRQNGQGLCRLLGRINGRVPSNCPNCLGYVAEIDGNTNTCPVQNPPLQYQDLTKLPGNDYTNGALLYQTDNVPLADCLNGCKSVQDVQWQCNQNGVGSCRYVGNINGRVPSNCPSCLGYQIQGAGPVCPVPPENTPSAFQGFRKLTGTDVPAGQEINRYQQQTLNSCLQLGAQDTRITGIYWRCNGGSKGECILYNKLTYKGPSNCPNCLGYVLGTE